MSIPAPAAPGPPYCDDIPSFHVEAGQVIIVAIILGRPDLQSRRGLWGHRRQTPQSFEPAWPRPCSRSPAPPGPTSQQLLDLLAGLRRGELVHDVQGRLAVCVPHMGIDPALHVPEGEVCQEHPIPPTLPWIQRTLGLRLTSSSSRTTSVFPQSAASCSAVPDLVWRLMSIPAWSRSLAGRQGEQAGPTAGALCPSTPKLSPDFQVPKD